jgi:hypothetical protein
MEPKLFLLFGLPHPNFNLYSFFLIHSKPLLTPWWQPYMHLGLSKIVLCFRLRLWNTPVLPDSGLPCSTASSCYTWKTCFGSLGSSVLSRIVSPPTLKQVRPSPWIHKRWVRSGTLPYVIIWFAAWPLMEMSSYCIASPRTWLPTFLQKSWVDLRSSAWQHDSISAAF